MDWYNRADMTLQELKRSILEATAEVIGSDQLDRQRLDVSWAGEVGFGDFATNAAMIYAKDAGRVPRELAADLASELKRRVPQLERIEVAGPGFINMTLRDEALAELTASAAEFRPVNYAGQVVVAEYSDANPFKVLHAGHVYTTVVGDAVANLMELAGGDVHRVNFGGDVGLHVGKTMWAIVQALGGEQPDGLAEIEPSQRAQWLAARYVEGERAYQKDDKAKAEIVALNKRVYEIHATRDHTSPVAQIYWTCRRWSYEAFDAFYARFGTRLEKYYPESEVAGPGLAEVKKHIGTVFDESDGAVVFRGEKYGLHTRVFITRQGLPTYETKDVGLIEKKNEDYHFDRSVILTDYEQMQYMQVVLKAIEQFWPKLARATTHIPHGKLKLGGGERMSSREGNIIRATEVLDMTAAAFKDAGREATDESVLGAVKYAFLKTRIGGDVTYVPKESISLEGNSGPYLQYAHARARSILAKADSGADHTADWLGTGFEPMERSLARMIAQYPSVVQQAVDELMPHYVCTYLYELAQAFNRFYEQNRVVGDKREDVRLGLVRAYADVLVSGLRLLSIAAPERL